MAYQAEVRRLRGEDVGSYHTASSGGQQTMRDQQQPEPLDDRGGSQVGAGGVPIVSPGAGGMGMHAHSRGTGRGERGI